MKLTKIISSLAIAAVVAFGTLGAPSLHAQETKEEPKKEEAKKVDATLDQRVAILEAALGNGDPTAPLKVKTKDDKGVETEAVPENLNVPGTAASSAPGHNGFMMICAALVLFMTLPGLALFYGGLVRKKNVLSVCAQCLGIAGLVAILWWAVGYSLVFGKSFGDGFFGLYGGSEFFMLKGVTSAPNTDYAFWIGQNTFSMYQLMFAIITPALIVGAIAERMKFSAVILFVTIWMFVIYFPMAHMIWGVTGRMNGVWNGDATIPAIDFAGGTVVHMTSGWSALVLCILLGKRLGFALSVNAGSGMYSVIVTGMSLVLISVG